MVFVAVKTKVFVAMDFCRKLAGDGGWNFQLGNLIYRESRMACLWTNDSDTDFSKALIRRTAVVYQNTSCGSLFVIDENN